MSVGQAGLSGPQAASTSMWSGFQTCYEGSLNNIFICFSQNFQKKSTKNQNGPKRPKMAPNGSKWPKMGHNDKTWSTLARNSQLWLKTATLAQKSELLAILAILDHFWPKSGHFLGLFTHYTCHKRCSWLPQVPATV
jgi:hypothetical protein